MRDPKPVRRVPDVGVIVITARGSNVARIVSPRAGTNDVGEARGFKPGRTIGRGALVVLVPAIRDPLVDAAPHVMEAERVRLEAAPGPRLRGVIGLVASLAVGRVGSKLVAPPEFRSRAAARGVLPFGFTRKPELLLRDLREPPRELLRVGPAYVGHRGVILAGRLIGACFRRHARFPFPHGDRKFAD